MGGYISTVVYEALCFNKMIFLVSENKEVIGLEQLKGHIYLCENIEGVFRNNFDLLPKECPEEDFGQRMINPEWQKNWHSLLKEVVSI